MVDMADEGDDGSVHRARTGDRSAGTTRRRRRRRGGAVSLITNARRSRLADWRHRRHLYATLQLARIPLFIIAVAVYGLAHQPVIAACVAVVSLPLPWIAVLLANEQGSDREKGQPKVYKPALVRENRARMAQNQLSGQNPGTAGRPRELGHGPDVIDASDPQGTDNTHSTDSTDNTDPEENH